MTRPTLAEASKIVDGALQCSKSKGYRPMAVVVVDLHGNICSAQREDGASMFRVDIAHGKAWAAVSMGCSSRVLAQRAKDNPTFFGALAATSHGKFVPHTGAVLIKRPDGDIIGAVGASGGTGDEDEVICMAGVLAAGLEHE
jgi:uncharacterized protein GlcG (DUF336 family)